MTYWTILWIGALGGPIEGLGMGLYYPSMEACMAAHQTVSETIHYDHTIACESTGQSSLSTSLRPRRRPS